MTTLPNRASASIRVKLIVLIAGILVLAFGGVAWTVRDIVYDRIVKNKIAIVDILTASMVQDINAEETSDHAEAASLVIAKYMTYYRMIDNINFYDDQGALTASSDQSRIGQRSPGPEVREALGKARPSLLVSHFGSSSIDLVSVAPVLQGSRVVGAFEINISILEVKAVLSQVNRRLGLVLLAAVLVAVVVVFFALQRIVLHRLGRLIYATHQVASRNYDFTLGDTSGDELGELAGAFDTMTSDLRRSHEEIAAYHADLERNADELRKAYADLLVAKEGAEQATLAKSEFLANISHELRTPMHAILSFANFGREKAASAAREKLLDYFTKIHTAGSRLLVLLNDLLDLSKLEANRMSMELALADVDGLIANAVDEFRSLVSERDIRIDLQGKLERPYLLDGFRIMQVVRNLMGNAVKFSPVGGTITVKAVSRPQSVLISVEDEGIGIPDDELELIFGKFIQSRKSKTGAGGTGLGLAICQAIVSAHHGRIWAEPGRSKGALFCLEIPDLGAGRRGGPAADPAEAARPRSANARRAA